MGFPLHGEEADIGGQILYSSDWYKRKETSKQGSVFVWMKIMLLYKQEDEAKIIFLVLISSSC